MMNISSEDLHTFSIDALHRIGERSLSKRVEIDWNPRMRSTAGRANLQSNTIEMNPKLQAFGEAEVYTTVLHELAHLIAWSRSRHRGHGADWKKACLDLSIPNEKATHTLPLPSRRQKKKWLYKCSTCKVSIQRVRKIKRKTACVACCKKYNKGRYSNRFLFDEFPLVLDSK